MLRSLSGFAASRFGNMISAVGGGAAGFDDREYDDQRLTKLIFEVHTAHPAYGVPRVTRELRAQGVPVCQRVVARLMREHGIAGITRRRRRNLTKPDGCSSFEGAVRLAGLR